MQKAPISDLVFDVQALIAYCSTFTELAPGDVIVTGTTGGVGAYRTPPLWMKGGDVVEIEYPASASCAIPSRTRGATRRPEAALNNNKKENPMPMPTHILPTTVVGSYRSRNGW